MSAQVEFPPLANFMGLDNYQPTYGDIVIWSGWFSCWFGVLTEYNQKTGEIHAIFGGLPTLLFNIPPEEHQKNTKTLSVSLLRRSRPGVFSILQHDPTRNLNVWYV